MSTRPKKSSQKFFENQRKKRLEPKNWSFLDFGLDDFRKGAPRSLPSLSDSQPPAQFIVLAKPPISNDESKEEQYREERQNYLGVTKLPENRCAKLNKDQLVLSKALPRSEEKKKYIQKVEMELLDHPLTLFPHLMDSVHPEHFKEISHLLESPLLQKINEEDFDSTELHIQVPASSDPSFNLTENKTINKGVRWAKCDSETLSSSKFTELEESSGNMAKPYQWLLRDEDMKKPVKTAREEEEEESNKRLDQVTKEFAAWANSLSSTTANVEPATIKALFASGYETKPALTVPIQVYELSTLPQELRIHSDIGTEDPRLSTLHRNHAPAPRQTDLEQSEESQESRPGYGAWYIKPNAWNEHYTKPQRDTTEMLLERSVVPQERPQDSKYMNHVENEDPNIAAIEKLRLKREAKEAFKRQDTPEPQKIENDLATLHSSRAFREYLEENPHLKRPDFMETIIQIQEEQANLTAPAP